MKRTLKFTSAALALTTLGTSLALLAGKDPIGVQCDTSSTCAVVKTQTGKVLIDNLPATPAIQKIAPGLYRVTSSCGSPCSASAYYDQRTGKLSALFPDVVAFSAQFRKVVYVSNGQFLYSPIFPGKAKPRVLKTKQPVAITAAPVSAVVAAKFVSETDIEMTFLSGPDFDEVTETLTP